MKAIRYEEMSKETDIRRTSPTVIARLMGLDELPPSKVVDKKQKEIRGHFLKTSYACSQEKYVPYEDHSPQINTPELQGVKDVFEVIETSKVEKDRDELIHKVMPRVKCETDVNFSKQNFRDTRCLSTGGTLRGSTEFNDALEDFDTSRDLFLAYFQEPNSLFTKHLHDLKCSPASSHASHITILKSSNSTKYERGEVCCKSEQVAEGCNNMKADVACSSRKPATLLLSHSFEEHGGSHSHKSSKLRHVGQNGACPHPSQIVVLKPSLEKAWNTGTTVSSPRAPKNFQFGGRRHREFGWPGFRESYREGRVCHSFFDNVDSLQPNRNSPREITRNITKKMRQSGSSGIRKASTSRLNRHISDESSFIMPGFSNLHNSVAFQRPFEHSNGWNSSYKTTYSSEYSVSREARKHLSERHKMINQFKEAEHTGRDMSSLGEMLALSDEERLRTILDSQSIHKVLDEKLARSEVPKTWGCPSRESWKDRYFINIPRSLSLSGSSKVYGPPIPCSRDQSGVGDSYILNNVLGLGPNVSLHGKLNMNGSPLFRVAKCDTKSQHLNSVGEENLPVWEIHVNPDDTRKRALVKVPAETKPMLPDFSHGTRADAGLLTDNFSAPWNMDSKISLASVQRQTKNMLPKKDGDSSDNDQNDLAMGETSDRPHVDCHLIHSGGTESGSFVSSQEVEQPSPVSVLELPAGLNSSLGCFERVSAELKELQMQLQLLQPESFDACAEGSELLVSGDEGTGGDCHSLQQIGDILQEFRDEEDRDFSYFLDMLIDSGVHAANQDRFYNSCYSPEYPVGPGVFEKLEKNYSKLVTWSRSERKLFFDLINNILAEILASCMDLQPWLKSNRRIGPIWGGEGLVEKVWQMLVKQRKELNASNPEEKILDFKWLELGDDVDVMGRKIEKMLKEDLLEELVSEFILG